MSTVVPVPSAPSHDNEFAIPPDAFFRMIERKDIDMFNEFGGMEGIVQRLHTSTTRGVPSNIETRTEYYGKNVLPEGDKISFFGYVFEALKDKMMILLIIAATISIILGMTLEDPETGHVERSHGWIEGFAILISVIIVVLVQSINDYQKAKKFEELNKEQSRKSLWVIRDGSRQEIDTTMLIVGDLVEISYGVTLPADGIFVEGQDLKTDEASATGESDIQKKNVSKDPFLLSGTDIVEGAGRMVVIGVGVHSFSGKLTMSTRQPPSETPLQEKLNGLANNIGKFGIIAALATFAALAIRYVVRQRTASPKQSVSAVKFVEFITISITIVVVAIPEGLPLAVTIALAYSMKSMLADNCLVRVLASCETMGGTTAICSDKTGTLTTNVMTVVQGWLAGEAFLFDGFKLDDTAPGLTKIAGGAVDPLKVPFKLEHTAEKAVDLICEAVALNSTAEEVPDEEGKLVWSGNKTEHGLLGFVKRAGRDYKKIRESLTHRRQYPFSSEKKHMTTVVAKDSTWVVYVKGASEMVLSDCEQYINGAGEAVQLSAVQRATIESAIEDMARQGNRTIGVAYAEETANATFPEEEPRPALTLIGILGIQDPIREEVPRAVKTCQLAGITVRMVTGDNINTAIAIAKKCGIFTEPNGYAMEGKDFREMHANEPEKLQELIPKLQVLARSSPTDKHILVATLMEQGEIVAVTGDGTNDAPALTLADVGFAMRSGTDVAVRASDMVLIDDNFASVVKATMWGRNVNDNVRKFLQFQLTVNVVGVLLTFIGSAVSEESQSPLKAVQLLWLNLIMDTMAALALATERPSEENLRREPVRRNASLISRKMWVFILGHASFQLVIVLVLLSFGHRWFNISECTDNDQEGGKMVDGYCRGGLEHNTIIFNVFILLQVFNQFNARKLYGELNIVKGLVDRSPLMLLIFFITLGFQIFAVEVAGPFMNTVPLNWWEWLICIAISALALPWGLVLRIGAMFVKENKGSNKKSLAGLDPSKAQEILRVVGSSSSLYKSHPEVQPHRSSKQFHAAASIHKRRDLAVRAFSVSGPSGVAAHPKGGSSVVGSSAGTVVNVREA